MAQGPVVYFFLLVVLLYAVIVKTQPQMCEDATSCCACVETPGCSWFYNASLSEPFCGETPFHEMPVDPSLELRSPASLNSSQYEVMRNEPINVARRRFLQPQEFRVQQNVGSRLDLEFNAFWIGRHLRMRVVDGTQNFVKFNVSIVHGDACPRGFSINHREGRGRRRLVLRCNREIPQDTTKFKLHLDLVSCFSGPRHIRVAIIGPGVRKQIRISVVANCKCPREITSPSALASSDSDEESESVGEWSLLGLARQEAMEVCDSDLATQQQTRCVDVNSACVDRETGQTCSGQGTCLCGECLCDSIVSSGENKPATMKYSGQFCECNDWSCPVDEDNNLCGGPEKGLCACGQCRCRPGWGEEACAYSTSDMCLPYPMYNGSTCNGHGVCQYGVCVCEPPYAGEYCTDCPWCVNPCNEHIFCVTCLFVDSTADQEQCHERCSSERTQYSLVDDNTEGEVCIFRHSSCNVQFSYSIDDNTGMTSVFVSTTQSCDAP